MPGNSSRRFHRCAWPDCRDESTDKADVPLCTQHALRAWMLLNRAVQEDLDGARGLAKAADREREFFAEQRRQKREATARDRRPGHVYYLRLDGRIKIGWSSDLKQRLSTYAPTATLLATHAGTLHDEQELHRTFAYCRTHGREWYDPSPGLMDHIETVRREHGVPNRTRLTPQAVGKWNGRSDIGRPQTMRQVRG